MDQRMPKVAPIRPLGQGYPLHGYVHNLLRRHTTLGNPISLNFCNRDAEKTYEVETS